MLIWSVAIPHMSPVVCTGGGRLPPPPSWPNFEKHAIKCLLGWLKHDKLPSWEPKRALKCPLQWQEHAVCALFVFSPLPFKKSVHTTVWVSISQSWLPSTVTNFYISQHCFVAKCLIQMFENMYGWNKTNLPVFFNLIICLQKLNWSNGFREFQDWIE